MKFKAPIAITSGDHRGIGPEVIAKGLYRLRKNIKSHDVIILGIPELYRSLKRFLPAKWHIWTENEVLNQNWPGPIPKQLNFVVPAMNHLPLDKRATYACGRYIEFGAQTTMRGIFSALTTGPIDKNELRKGGYPFDGHTEMLRTICGAPTVTMMMAGPKMRTALVTIHEPLRDVSSKLSIELIVSCIQNTVLGLIRDFGIKKPSLAVLGLNPHASDKGLFGNEEATKIEPAILRARSQFPNAHIEGPFPPDGFFAQWHTRHSKEFDAIICMYHDQGLIPAKLLDFENTVNVSLGLPIVRTSVDHGVGYDIVGKNKADASSFCAALKLAATMVRQRRRK